tara:strand:+ start:7978 stop:8274 length:297 start_codon:yes stop_codon:yes gene_type:complete
MKFYVISGGLYNDSFCFTSKKEALRYANKDLGIYPREWEYDWSISDENKDYHEADKCYGKRSVKILAYAPGNEGETYFLKYVDIHNSRYEVMRLIEVL